MSDLYYTTDVDDRDDLEWAADFLDRMATETNLRRRHDESDAELRARITARLAANTPTTIAGIRNALEDLRGVYRAQVNEVHAEGHAPALDVRITATPEVSIDLYGELHGEIEATLRELVPVGVAWTIAIEREERQRYLIGDDDDGMIPRGRW